MTLDPDLVAKIVGYAAAVGLLWPIVQSLIQRPTTSPKVKAGLHIAAAIVFGIAGYLVQFGLDFSSPEAIISWVVGVYAAIMVIYRGLKSTVYDRLEATAGRTDTMALD